jgi:hypothetical protein
MHLIDGVFSDNRMRSFAFRALSVPLFQTSPYRPAIAFSAWFLLFEPLYDEE